MHILHIAAECYPILKAGGMGDVLGSLPKYQNSEENPVSVIVPFHDSKYVINNFWTIDYENSFIFGWNEVQIRIWRQSEPQLGFQVYLVEVPGMFPRQEVYGYDDDVQRFIFFQIVVLNWINQMDVKPKVVHCHDHTTGLVPFLMKHAWSYHALSNIPSVFTIHNGEYQGGFAWDMAKLFPQFDTSKTGYLDFNGIVNPLISAVKNAWAVTTVSNGYMEELEGEDSALGQTLRDEHNKSHGILNGIDSKEWSPATDKYLHYNYDLKTVTEGKRKNKEELCFKYGLNPEVPLMTFIGRMVDEKGVDYLKEAIYHILQVRKDVCFMIIGSGNKVYESEIDQIKYRYPENFNTYIGYSEPLARLAYASADFLLMPSRVEPCGLNQMYAMQYGTIPIVRKIGGLRETVNDIEDGGEGFTFVQPNSYDLSNTIHRALNYDLKGKALENHRKNLMQKDFSWENSAQKYVQLYKSIIQ